MNKEKQTFLTKDFGFPKIQTSLKIGKNKIKSDYPKCFKCGIKLPQNAKICYNCGFCQNCKV